MRRESPLVTICARPRLGHPPAQHLGTLRLGARTWPCSLGRTGISHAKREGDGATPAGLWRVLYGLWRADRLPRPRTLLPMRPIQPKDGWCDAPGHACYNRPVRLPFAASHEQMRRTDGLYDIVLVIDHNQRPRTGRGGSAVFLHIRPPDDGPTAGCVAVSLRDMKLLLQRLKRGSRILIR